jgi:hypothetical protein
LKRVLLGSLVGVVAVLGLLLLATVGVGVMAANDVIDTQHGILAVMGFFAVLIMVGAFVIGVFWMRSIDEAAREAHKWAWYWGGTAGMSLGGVLMILSSLPQASGFTLPVVFGGRADPAGYAATGAFAMMMLMVIGYTIAWAIWWWRHR